MRLLDSKWRWLAAFALVVGSLWLMGSSAIQSAYDQIQNNKVNVTPKRQILNFPNGGCSDDPTNLSTDCTLSSGGAAGSGIWGGVNNYSATVAATQYYPITGAFGTLTGITTTEADQQIPSAVATSAGSLYVFLTNAPGSGNTLTFTLRDNASNTTLTCAITGSATTCDDVTHTPNVSAGDLLSLGVVVTGTAATVPTGQIAYSFLLGASATAVHKYSNTFTNQTSVTFTDGLGTSNKLTQCFDGSGNQIIPQNIENTSSTVVVTFSASQSGSCTIIG